MFTKKGVSRISERALYYSQTNPLWAYCCSYDLAHTHNVPYSILITVHSKTLKKNQRSITHYSIIATDIWGRIFVDVDWSYLSSHWSIIAVTRLNKYATPPNEYPSLQTDQEISIKKTRLPDHSPKGHQQQDYDDIQILSDIFLPIVQKSSMPNMAEERCLTGTISVK